MITGTDVVFAIVDPQTKRPQVQITIVFLEKNADVANVPFSRLLIVEWTVKASRS